MSRAGFAWFPGRQWGSSNSARSRRRRLPFWCWSWSDSRRPAPCCCRPGCPSAVRWRSHPRWSWSQDPRMTRWLMGPSLRFVWPPRWPQSADQSAGWPFQSTFPSGIVSRRCCCSVMWGIQTPSHHRTRRSRPQSPPAPPWFWRDDDAWAFYCLRKPKGLVSDRQSVFLPAKVPVIVLAALAIRDPDMRAGEHGPG